MRRHNMNIHTTCGGAEAVLVTAYGCSGCDAPPPSPNNEQRPLSKRHPLCEGCCNLNYVDKPAASEAAALETLSPPPSSFQTSMASA
jgi:hypothetical protein